ncbi:MAG: hypothetical protein IPH84_08185 [Bacteroidales bacterium]|nr:hypothetical protein [Bacteroidales bacterium]
MRIKNYKKLILSFAIGLMPFVLLSQTGNTPYSRYGIGKLYSNSNSYYMAMGGSAIGVRSPLFVNPYNPASYTSFDSTSFIFDAAMFANAVTLKTSAASEKLNDAGLAYITMGFPITRWWKSSLGVLPYSVMGYKIGIDSVLSGFGKVEYSYSGNGGLNRAYIGNAFQPFKNLSVGVNLSYIFGTLDKERSVSFPDSTYIFGSKLINSTIVRNLHLEFGLQYHDILKNGTSLTAGLTFSPNQSLGTTYDFLAVSYFHNYTSNLDVTTDTAVFESGKSGSIGIPLSIGGGFSLAKQNRWLATADIQYQKWEDFSFLGSSGLLKNSLRISVGGQYKPSPLDIGKYYNRINYRMGFKFEQSNLELRNTRLNDFGISFGIGLPMKKSRSTVNLAIELGTFGTTDNQLIKENYFRFTVGASMFEKWFLKRKYD